MHLNLEYKGYKFNPQKSKIKVFNAKFYPYDPHTKALSLQNLKFLSANLFQLFFFGITAFEVKFEVTKTTNFKSNLWSHQ